MPLLHWTVLAYNTELGRCTAVSERQAALESTSHCRQYPEGGLLPMTMQCKFATVALLAVCLSVLSGKSLLRLRV